MADHLAATLRRAEREGWATYMPTPVLYVTGALAALGVMLIPAPLYFVISVIAIVGELVRQIPFSEWIGFIDNALASYAYLISVWPYIVGGIVTGLFCTSRWQSRIKVNKAAAAVGLAFIAVMVAPLVVQMIVTLIDALVLARQGGPAVPGFSTYAMEVGPFALVGSAVLLYTMGRRQRHAAQANGGFRLGPIILVALGIAGTPFFVHLVVATIAALLHLVRHGRVDLFATLYPNGKAFVYYVTSVWPFILVGTALGVPLAFLRQKHGFYRREVRGNAYRYVADRNRRGATENQARRVSREGYKQRFRLPVYPHVLVLYIAGPIIMWSMAYYVDPWVYPGLLYNAFAVWLASGIAARFVWEWLQGRLLRLAHYWCGQPRRSLQGEYQLKGLIESDPALSYFSVWDVSVDVRQRHALVMANIRGDAALRRLKELGAFIQGVDTIEVRESLDVVRMAPAPVSRTQQEARSETLLSQAR